MQSAIKCSMMLGHFLFSDHAASPLSFHYNPINSIIKVWAGYKSAAENHREPKQLMICLLTICNFRPTAFCAPVTFNVKDKGSKTRELKMLLDWEPTGLRLGESQRGLQEVKVRLFLAEWNQVVFQAHPPEGKVPGWLPDSPGGITYNPGWPRRS